MSELFFDDKTMCELRRLEPDLLVYNYGEDLQVLREDISQLQERIVALEALLIERDGGTHDDDCKIHNPGIKQCNCGHEEVNALLGSKAVPEIRTIGKARLKVGNISRLEPITGGEE